MGFVRRFSNFPSVEVLQEIEGIVTVDQTAPGAIAGVSAGVACCIGEFADCSLGVAIDVNGVVTTLPNPTEVISGQDAAVKFGGWDETLGEFGVSGGSGFLEIKNKQFSRLVLVAINVASSHGARVFRKLPTNNGPADATPVVPLVGGVVVAGREFRSGANRVRSCQRVVFSETASFISGVDGAVTSVGAAANQLFTSAGGGFTTVVRPDGTKGLLVGDILVLGQIGGAGALGANADTYRVQAVNSDTTCHLEKMDGTNFDWTTGTNEPWRVHVPACADSGSVALATQSGYRIPSRPLDATIAASTNLQPTVAPPALTASSADALSGLEMRTDPSTGLVYTAAIQAPNAVASASWDALYSTAIDSLLEDDLPEREVNIVWAARSSATIDAKLTSHVLAQKANGVGRIAVVSPSLATVALATAIGDASPGVGANRARERIYDWPGLQTFVGEAVGVPIKGADGLLYTNGILDTPSQSWSAAIMSQLAPERNPGQASDPVKTIMSLAIGIQRGVSGLNINAYKLLKSKGIMGPRNDRDSGRIFQSGVTSSLLPGEAEIYTRRFSFFVEDSVAAFLAPYSKEPMTEALKDKILTALHDFFEELASSNNKTASRIRGFSVNGKDGNTAELSNAGIYVVQYAVEMIPIANTIVQQASVGYGVLNVQQLAG